MTGHLLELVGEGEDQYAARIICPDGGAKCVCWMECTKPHPCEECDDPDCHDTLWETQMSHDEYHEMVGGMWCVQVDGCWMQTRGIEFDYDILGNTPAGLYRFEIDDDADDFSCDLYIISIEPETNGDKANHGN